MLTDITLGQYFPGNSYLHRLDPRMKIMGTMIFIFSVFLANDPLSYADYGEVAEASLGNYYFHLRRSCFYDSGQRVVGLRLDSYYGRRYLSGLFHDFETCVFNCLFISFDLYNFSHCSY